MDFAAAESYLFSLGNEVETMKLGLENIRKLLGALGDPQKNYVKVQVAGTNGKGSVCAFLDSICLQAGIHTGRYTSPHLISITERVKIDGVDIAESEFAQLATRVRETSEKLVADGELERVATFFEQVTAIALLAFAEAKVELAILETGLGGRFDAVTAAEAEIAVIARIDLDHQEYLGDTVERIAAEKAAIIRQGSKVIVVDQSAEVMNVINEVCLDKGVSPCVATAIGLTALGFPPRQLGLAGQHQFENARAATATALTLRGRFEISDDDIVAGLENARHPGRLERIGNFLLDGAHNVGGASALRKYLDDVVTEPFTLIFGVMKDKNVAELAAKLFPKAGNIILVAPPNARALSAADILKKCDRKLWRRKPVHVADLGDALELAEDISGEDGFIVVTGSLYLVGAIRRLLDKYPQVDYSI